MRYPGPHSPLGAKASGSHRCCVKDFPFIFPCTPFSLFTCYRASLVSVSGSESVSSKRTGSARAATRRTLEDVKRPNLCPDVQR
ncbi:hypothetical protein E2C01_073966 [Portunus trituberculatus]|uniref:Uncharacterized protein n=1 Tax=Portunus trituberculatus TaxID=210409 RepID=A0A5B7IF30_PORTR|nr:hypothetical protein [Portunus trituberculatus]